MALGKKVGFINMSGNSCLNYPFRDLDIEYNLNSRISFEEYVTNLFNKTDDYKAYILQNKKYTKDMVEIIKSALCTVIC